MVTHPCINQAHDCLTSVIKHKTFAPCYVPPSCDEIFLNGVHVPHTSEAYTTVHLPASTSNKAVVSLWVKVDNGASGDVLPLHLFRHLYPNCIEKTGHPTGLNASNTRLTVYNGTWITLFGSLHGPIIWQPGSPHAQPHQINSCWYVADTSGPAILGLPSCDRLEVVKMTCAVKLIQDTFHLPSPISAPPTPKKQFQSSLQRTSSESSQTGSKP